MWVWIGQSAYIIILVLVCLRIIYDTRSTTKTIAYLLLTIFLPIAGMIFYFSFGTNYRKRKIYSRKLIQDEGMLDRLKADILFYSQDTLEKSDPDIQSNKELAHLLLHDLYSPLTGKNQVKLLINGEEKFPEVLEALKQAKHHIHIEYYIYENDEIGCQLAEILMQKVSEGVQVRFIYDDFGSRSIRKKLVPKLRAAGVQIFPFYKIVFIRLANRLNYRNHRKIIIIDGRTAFTGGINISDRYINRSETPGLLYWRDTHMRIDGPGIYYLQHIFLTDWNFCSGEKIQPDKVFFADPPPNVSGAIVQIAASGPDYDYPSILFSILEATRQAHEEILITTPYFIPTESMLTALTVVALAGLKVKMLVPGESDVGLVNWAARSYYEELLTAGVEIYLYKKGFVHAKTLVIDGTLAMIGTANMDCRSFELNFEVNAIVYDKPFASEVRRIFYEDLQNAEKIDLQTWCERPFYIKLGEKVARLVSPLL